MNEQKKIEQIAESYINGNLSWVKTELKNKINLVAEVYHNLKELNEKEAESFMSWIRMW